MRWMFLLFAATALLSAVLPTATVLACTVSIALAVVVLELFQGKDTAEGRERNVDAFGVPREV